jgi:hypothetical protein
LDITSCARCFSSSGKIGISGKWLLRQQAVLLPLVFHLRLVVLAGLSVAVIIAPPRGMTIVNVIERGTAGMTEIGILGMSECD